MEVSGQLQAPGTIPHRKEPTPHFSLNKRLGEPKANLDISGGGRNSCLCQDLNPGSSNP